MIDFPVPQVAAPFDLANTLDCERVVAAAKSVATVEIDFMRPRVYVTVDVLEIICCSYSVKKRSMMGSCVIKIEGFQFPTSNTSCEFFNLFMKK
jgi:hypothetical protein